MPTPNIQTLVTDAQQVLNLDSISAVRSVVAVALANANTGTPLNPNLTTQQLWNEFYQVVTKPKSDIESIIANQLMKFLFAPPAPGGVGANKQVIFNDGGVLAGDADFQWDKTANKLTINGDITLTGTTVPITEYFADVGANADFGAALTVRSNANPNVYRQRIIAIRGQYADAMGWKFTTQSGSGTEKESLIVSPIGNIFVNGSTTVSTTNYIGASGWAAQFLGSSNGAASGISLLSYSGSGLPAPVSIHAVPVADYRSGMVATFSADASGAGYFAVNQFNPTTSSTVERIRVDRDGNVDVKAGNVIVSNGKGIDFSATASGSGTMTSELLSDYEEGTFVATLKGSVSDPTTPVTALARYTKIGREVKVSIFFANVNTTGASGNLRIGGLPFVSANDSIGTWGAATFYNAATFTGYAISELGPNTTIMEFPWTQSNGVSGYATHNAGANRYVSAALMYNV